MPLALFDILTNNIANENIEAIDPDKYLYLSIQAHLMRLLNTRQNSLAHLPDYGLPDIAEIYKGLPYSVNELTASIKFTIEKYEPRLKNIFVQHLSGNDKNNILHLRVYGKISSSGESVQFDTHFTSNGLAQIKQYNF